MKKQKLEPAQEFATVKECLKSAVEKYAKNIANRHRFFFQVQK